MHDDASCSAHPRGSLRDKTPMLVPDPKRHLCSSTHEARSDSSYGPTEGDVLVRMQPDQACTAEHRQANRAVSPVVGAL